MTNTTTRPNEMTTLAADALARAEKEAAAGRVYSAREFVGYYREAVKRGGVAPVDGAQRAATVAEQVRAMIDMSTRACAMRKAG